MDNKMLSCYLANYIKYLYDVTVAFPENLVQSELDLIAHGVCPSKVQYEVMISALFYSPFSGKKDPDWQSSNRRRRSLSLDQASLGREGRKAATVLLDAHGTENLYLVSRGI